MKVSVLLMKIYANYNIYKNELHFEIGTNRVVVVIKWNQLYECGEFYNHQAKVKHSCRLFLLTLFTT